MDDIVRAREGGRQLARNWREGMAYDLSETAAGG
jgi:hypothetical protein